NRRWLDYTGQTWDEAMGLGGANATHPDDRPEVMAAWEAAVEAHAAYELEFRLRRADGQYRWCVARAEPLLDANGEIEGWIGTTTDTHERRATSERLERVLESMGDANFTLDEDYRFTYLNSNAARALHTKAAELLGRQIWEAYPALLGTELEARYRQVMDQGGAANFEWHSEPLQAWLEIRAARTDTGLSVFFRDVTESRRLQAERETLLAQMRSLLDNAPIGLTFLDTEGRYLMINPTLARLNRLPVEAHLGKRVREVLPELADSLEVLLAEVLETGQPLLNVLVPGDSQGDTGRPGVWLTSYFPVRASDGSVLGVGILAEDHTEREAAQRALAESEERYRALVRATSQIVWTVGPEGLVEDIPEWRAYTGQSLEASRGWGWLDAIHPEDRERATRDWNDALARHGLYETQYRVRGADGVYRPFETRGVPVLNPDGTVREWVGANTDVSARVAAQERTRRLQDVTAALVHAYTTADMAEAIDAAILPASGANAWALATLEPDGATLAFAGYRGFREEQMRDWPRVPLAAPIALSDAVREQRTIVLESPEAARAAYPRVFDREITTGHVAWAYLPLEAHGHPTGALVLAYREPRAFDALERDELTAIARQLALAVDRARLYDAEKQARATLEDRVRERTRELEERNAESEQFIYTASHDLRTPLVSLSGMTQYLKDALAENDATGVNFAVERIDTNVTHMGELLSDLLALSRVGRVVEPAQALDLGKAVNAAVALQEGRLRETGVAVEFPPAWPRVVYPPTELAQVLANLLSNALKWAPRGGRDPRVAFTWEQRANFVSLTISDTGPGVPEPLRERVWGLFQKLDPKSEGTGVGLAIVKRIVERHGGKIAVGDSPLGGAAFCVSLPSAEAARPDGND
ncbi:MAG TPA: PAS domain-containing protein, partial [Deinococcales bacterium]|nr:PAS domain-containing protein [Deinococcales bacterium]